MLLWQPKIINLLLTMHGGCTGEYWLKVLAVVRTKMTKGQCSPVHCRAGEVSLSSLFYGLVSLSEEVLLVVSFILTSGANLKMRGNFPIFGGANNLGAL